VMRVVLVLRSTELLPVLGFMHVHINTGLLFVYMPIRVCPLVW